MNAALYYHSDAFDTSRPKLMGRHAAGEGFLRGYARYSDADVLYCYTSTDKQFADFKRRVVELTGRERPCAFIPYSRRHELARPGCLFVPAPGLNEFAWQRRFGDAKAYSICGVTHTTASHGVMNAIGDLLIAPIQPWDAVICTSAVVRATFAHVLDNWSAYLNDRFGGEARCPAQLPVIPLGVECDEMAPSRARKKTRLELRGRLGIGDKDIAVLFMGRLSYHAKAHPLPMYLGLEEAARRTGKPIHLIQAGWFGNKAIENAFIEGAKLYCPSVRAVFLDGRKPEVRANVWTAADIFCSLSDNVQETFGLTPAEAMAAGLPIVVSDWDGYRDTIRDGIDGFAIPTAMPPPGTGEGFAYRHLMELDNYDHYIGNASQCVAVDVKACADALTALVKNKSLRRRMGEAGRKRAREEYDWRVVVAAYQELWKELAERREAEAEAAPRRPGAPAHPLRDDPFSVFAGYPTAVIEDDTLVAIADGADEAHLERIRSQPMNDFAAAFLAPLEETRGLLRRLAEGGPSHVADILAPSEGYDRVKLHRTIGWLAKTGLVSISYPASPEAPEPGS